MATEDYRLSRPTWTWIARRDVPEFDVAVGDAITLRDSPEGEVWTVHRRRRLSADAVALLEEHGSLEPLDLSPRASRASPPAPSAHLLRPGPRGHPRSLQPSETRGA